jgi:hypothetical protein
VAFTVLAMTKQAQRFTSILMIAILVALGGFPLVKAAPAIAVPSGLSLVEIKMTGDEFVILQNNTDQTLDLRNYWLTAYNNVNPLTAGVSSASQQLPSALLLAGQTLLLSADPMQTCGASIAGKLSVGLTDGGGFMQLTSSHMNQHGAIEQTAGDFVSWSSGVGGVVSNVPSSTKSPKAAYYRYTTGSGFAWQQAALDTVDSCQLNIVVAGGVSSSSAVTPLTLAATSPPATILGLVQSIDGSSVAVMPAGNIGLLAPQISELLANPVGTGNDTTDEFIELYNPNPRPFELTGFTLQTGLKTFKSYEFPEGTMLEPSAFKAFSSKDTKLALSNTSSQAFLIDPFGNTLASSDPYKNAKDGIGWAHAQGKWLWTTKLTPGAANIIQQPPTKKSTAKTPKRVAKPGQVGSSSAVSATAAPNANGHPEIEQATVVHYWVLALIAGLALLYGLYEYRRDLAQRLRKLSRKLGSRRTARQPAEGSGSD